jgi:hypothetical protein
VCTTQSLILEKLEVHATISHKVPEIYSFFHLDRGWWSMSCTGCFTLGKETQYPLYRRLGGPKGLSGQLQKILPSPAFSLLTIQPIVNCCTYGAVPCISLMCYKIWNCNTKPIICLIIVGKMTLMYVISLYLIGVVCALFDLCTLAVTCPLSKWFVSQCCNGIWRILGELHRLTKKFSYN